MFWQALTEVQVTADPRVYVTESGMLDIDKLLIDFLAFWREHAEVLTTREDYPEAAPHLVLMAYLSKLVNGGGYVDREYGLGYKRIDLLIRWPYENAAGKRVWQRAAMELKVWHPGAPDPLPNGLEQLDDYMDRLSLDAGTLIVFDRRPDAASILERTTMTAVESPAGRKITLIRV